MCESNATDTSLEHIIIVLQIPRAEKHLSLRLKKKKMHFQRNWFVI